MKKLLLWLCGACVCVVPTGCSSEGSDLSAVVIPLDVPVPVLAMNGDRATVTWRAVDHASLYAWELTTDADATPVEGVSAATGHSFSLEEDAVYSFRVMAKAEAGSGYSDSPWSSYVVFTTRQHEQLAAPVAAVKSRTAVSADLAWSPVDKAVEYAYRLYESSLESSPVQESTTSEVSITLSGLKESTDYWFVIRSIADEADPYTSDSEDAAAVSFRTKSQSAADFDPELPEHEMDGLLRAFPGAEGAGMFTTGGRGGAVYHVANLNDSGPGSLREAIGKVGARTIVFDVAGNIELKSTLKIANGNLTIAGQTAPGDGICIKGYGVEVNADNVIIRYLRFRPGDENGSDGTDALGGRYMQNIIIDHCSMSWSTDECVSFYVNRNMTMQYCLAYESLRNGGHGKGSHGYGGIWGGAPASFHHNILAHHDSRNPRFDSPDVYVGPEANPRIPVSDRCVDFRNNVVYNFCETPACGGEGLRLNFVGNLYKWGPASVAGAGPRYALDDRGVEVEMPETADRWACFYRLDGIYTAGEVDYDYGAADIYDGGNSNLLDTLAGDSSLGEAVSRENPKGFPLNDATLSLKKPEATFLAAPLPIRSEGRNCFVTTHDASQLPDVLCAYAGVVRYAEGLLRRDAADSRALSDVKSGTAAVMQGSRKSRNGLVDSQSDVGGWPELTATPEEIARAAKDTDKDGIPDYYEDLFGLDSGNAADANEKRLDPQGLYTNLEIYLHYLVKDITRMQTATGNYTELR